MDNLDDKLNDYYTQDIARGIEKARDTELAKQSRPVPSDDTAAHNSATPQLGYGHVGPGADLGRFERVFRRLDRYSGFLTAYVWWPIYLVASAVGAVIALLKIL